MEKSDFHNLLFFALREMMYNISQEDKIEILKRTYEAELISKAKDIAYRVLKLRKEETHNIEYIEELLGQIKEIIKNVTYSLDEQVIKDGIDTIFEEAKSL